MLDKNKNGGKITKIKTQKTHGRYNIYINDQYTFSVEEAVMMKYHIKNGMKLDGMLVKHLIQEDDLSKIWKRALDYIEFQQHTEQELINYLLSMKFDIEDIETIITRLKDKHLVDDKHYAYSYVRTIRKTSDKGPAVISRRLRNKGISDYLIKISLMDEFDETVQIKQVSKQVPKIKRKYDMDLPVIQEQKVRKRLIARGFSSDVISHVLAETDFEMRDNEKKYLLNVQAEKLWRRNVDMTDSARHQKIWQTLYYKGFPSDDINNWLNVHETNTF